MLIFASAAERYAEIVADSGINAKVAPDAWTRAVDAMVAAIKAGRPGDGFIAAVELCGAEILKLCVELGGCLTGEHGVGIEKRDLMGVQFSEVDLAQQMRIKTAFDPDWLLNPGKVFPLEARGQQ